MAIRRQGYLFEFKDIGNLPIIRIDELSTRQQSIMVGLDIDDGFGVLTKSLYTPADQFIVLEYVGSTPGGGISGIGAPFPVSLNYQPAYKTFIPIEIPPGTWYDVRYIAYNRVVEIETQFTACTTPTDVAGVGDMITFLDYVKP